MNFLPSHPGNWSQTETFFFFFFFSLFSPHIILHNWLSEWITLWAINNNIPLIDQDWNEEDQNFKPHGCESATWYQISLERHYLSLLLRGWILHVTEWFQIYVQVHCTRSKHFAASADLNFRFQLYSYWAMLWVLCLKYGFLLFYRHQISPFNFYLLILFFFPTKNVHITKLQFICVARISWKQRLTLGSMKTDEL